MLNLFEQLPLTSLFIYISQFLLGEWKLKLRACNKTTLIGGFQTKAHSTHNRQTHINTRSRHVEENTRVLIKTVVYAADFRREDYSSTTLHPKAQTLNRCRFKSEVFHVPQIHVFKSSIFIMLISILISVHCYKSVLIWALRGEEVVFCVHA